MAAPTSLKKIAYHTLQQGKTLAGLAHKELSTKLMEVFAPEADPGKFPIDQDLIDHKLLDKKEKDYLFRYHYEVYLNISPFLNKNEKKWLASFI